ncbi:MAG TPA: lysylphosphatidylglycerol synthase transmembrane domain-containing protein [Anaerolineales bacterium]|nr:lysylphosphatidylglycerol synthase transmembrane domain-containing protein [Anaerolineales bacterium]
MPSWWIENRRRVLQLSGTVLAAVLLIVLVRKSGWDEIVATFANIKTSTLLWAALLFFISRTSMALRWHVLLRSGGINLHLKDSISLTYTGLFASNFLPSTIGGDIVRLAGTMQMGYDRAVCLASIAADRLIGVTGMTMVLPVGLVHSWGFLGADPASLSTVVWFKRPMAFLKRTFSVFRLWLNKPLSLLESLTFTWLHMLCLFGSIFIFVNDLGSHVSFWMIAGLWSITYFVTLLPISINGYGLQELSFTFFMSNVAGLTPAISLSVAVLIRAYFILSSLPGALFLPTVLSAVKKRDDESLPASIFQ